MVTLLAKKKVAAYCRVSTDKDDQLSSLSVQKEFFEAYAQQHHLTLVEIYADEGISGTKLKNRTAFQRMMRDAERRRFDCIYVKDISRMARNVVDFLQSIRKLKSLGVDCKFVTTNMSTEDGELTLTILAAVAQEESANLSKRVKFGKKRNAEKGRVANLVYGYNKINGNYFDLEINDDEASVIRKMFALYVRDGYGFSKIAQYLNEHRIKTKRNGLWYGYTVGRILENSLYIGKIVNGKSEVKDFLTGKRVQRNVEDYFIVDNPKLAIIEPELFYQAKQILQQRYQTFKMEKTRHSNKYCFSTLIKCVCCGYSFRRLYKKRLHGEYIRWVCTGRNAKGKDFCDNRTSIEEKKLRAAIKKYLFSLIRFPEKLLEKTLVEVRRKYSSQQGEQNEKVLRNQLNQLKKAKAKQTTMFEFDAITIEELKIRTEELNTQIRICQEELQTLKGAKDASVNSEAILAKYGYNIKNLFADERMDTVLIQRLIEKIIVNPQGAITVQLKLFSDLATHGEL